MKGDSSSAVQATLQGGVSFVKDMQPLGRGIVADNAKALLLKDTDYSTPSDHYFAHLQKLKTEFE
jgi:hypothetical protein